MPNLFATRALAAAALMAIQVPAARADTIQVTLTVDNSYALFIGNATAATQFVGSNFSWQGAETFNFTLDRSSYLYVVTSSDLSTAQGFLGQLRNVDTGVTAYSQDAQWQVMATGLGSAAPYTGSAADLALLAREIQDANAGGNPSQGWVATTAGPANGAATWGTIGGIDSSARWVWYSANGDTDPTTPGFNHDEWLAFRIAVATVPEPAPSALLLAGLGALALLGRPRRGRIGR